MAKRVITPAQRNKMIAGIRRAAAAKKSGKRKQRVTEVSLNSIPAVLGAFPKPSSYGKGKSKKLVDVTRERDMLRALVLFYISKED